MNDRSQAEKWEIKWEAFFFKKKKKLCFLLHEDNGIHYYASLVKD